MPRKSLIVALGGAVVVLGSTLAPAQQAGTTSLAQPAFSAEEQAARQEIVDGDRWRAAHQELDKWLSVQMAYDDEQVARLKTQLQQQIEGMSASQLQDFLAEMEDKLKVLMSPETSQARSWVQHYFTPQVQGEMVKRFGVQDPLQMTAAQIKEALSRFESERNSRRGAQTGFQQSREQQVANLRAQQQAQAQASERARDRAALNASRSSSPSPSAYAPQQVHQRYSSPSGGSRFSIGPWGGIWW